MKEGMDDREGEEREEGLTKEKEEKKLVQRTERQEAKRKKNQDLSTSLYNRQKINSVFSDT